MLLDLRRVVREDPLLDRITLRRVEDALSASLEAYRLRGVLNLRYEEIDELLASVSEVHAPRAA